MHRSGSSSAVLDTSFGQKCLSIRCQWLLCIGRLVSKHRKVMHWCGSHQSISETSLCIVDWVPSTYECLHGASIQCELAVSDSMWLGFSWSLFWVCLKKNLGLQGDLYKSLGTCQSWLMFGWLALPNLTTTTNWNLVELISCWWCRLFQRRSEWFLSCIWWRPHVTLTSLDHLFWGV